MVKLDEIRLMMDAIESNGGANCLFDKVRDCSRGHYVLGKWANRDWWDYGVSLRTGWLTEKGRKEIPKAIAKGVVLLYKKGILRCATEKQRDSIMRYAALTLAQS